jgi:protein gp37
MGTKIEWTDETVNPVRGCRRKSAGCQRCYAERLAATRLRHLDKYKDLAAMTPNGPRWSGKVQLDIDAIKKVLKWKKSKRIFVCDMSDLFYEEVPDDFIERVFAVMAVAQQHQFQILTKRSDRMLEWFNTAPVLYKERAEAVAWWAEAMDLCIWDARGDQEHLYTLPMPGRDLSRRKVFPGWPLPNVWLGVSAEDQEAADERIPDLLNTPAATRYISYEPALGPIEFEPSWLSMHLVDLDGNIHMPQAEGISSVGGDWKHGLDWVIAGAESGPGHRPCEIEWMQSAKDQCEQAKVAFFFKQFVENGRKVSLPVLDGRTWDQYPKAG